MALNKLDGSTELSPIKK